MSDRPPFSLLSVVANRERHSLASGEPFLLLMDLAWPGDAAVVNQTHLRFVRDLNDLLFDAGDGLGPQLYTAFNFSIGDLKMSTDGSMPDCELSASNVGRALQSAIEGYAGGVGANIMLYVVNTANPAGEPEMSVSLQVKETTADAKNVKFKLGASSPLRRLFPIHRYYPNRCIWQYKSIQCGYTGDMPTCSLTIDGTTGCQAHNNLIRIGAFPGIDTNGYEVASVV